MKIIFATSNAGKMREIRMILADLDAEILSLKEAGLSGVEIIENGRTFEENALIKVNTLRRFTDAIILADDSGLVIDALDGEPGIYSARYMGEETSYEKKNSNLIARVDASGRERTARFVCSIAASIPAAALKMPKTAGSAIAINRTTTGTMEGVIAKEAAGEGGFGYDPILYLPEFGMTSAQITAEQKNEISHRGKALRAMKEVLKELCKAE